MTASSMTLRSYLAAARAALAAPAAEMAKTPLTFVVGNESAGAVSKRLCWGR
jgi:hypothetical protein